MSKLSSPSELTISDRTRKLFEQAALTVQRTTRLPINISILNDKMRAADRTWHVLDETGGTFAMLAARMETEGLIKTNRKKESHMLT